MANVTIKLTVNTEGIHAHHPSNSELGRYCQLSQSGGEELGNHMSVDFEDSTQNISHVTENDVITWEGVPANGDPETSIEIISVEKDQTGGGSLLGNAFNVSWYFGKTVIRQVLSESGVDEESYTIYFSIQSDTDSVYAFDPKIKVHMPAPFIKKHKARVIDKSL